MNRKLLSKLIKLHIITPGGVFNFLKSISRDGVTILALLRFAASYYPNRCALVSEGKRFSYKEMYDYANNLTKILYTDYAITKGKSVGML